MLFRGLESGRGEQEKIAVIVAGAIGEQIERDILFLRREEELEIGIGPDVLRLVTDDGVVWIGPLDFDVVGGRIDGGQRMVGLDIDLHADIVNQRGGKLLGVERVDVTDQARVGLEHFSVGDLHLLASASLDRINPDAKDAPVCVFEQRGIALAPDDILVNGAGLVGGKQLGLRLLPVDLHRELVDLRVLRDGKEIGTLELLRIRIVEFLIDARRGDLAIDLHVDVVIAHLERRKRKRHGRPRHRAVDDDESIRADGCRQGREQRGYNEKKRSSFHVANFPRKARRCVRSAGKICKKDVTLG